ncbi:iron uptake transporter permease EfeU [Neorhizobium turbinariae]|nr:iron uptake transporter permease EfeU [Neorhizobium turbinariae]
MGKVTPTFAPFLIMLREGIEAALIVGIVAGYLRRTGRSAWMPAVWIGILLAVSLSLLVGAALQFANAQFPQKLQEGFEAAVGLIAVVVLVSMVFWMKKAARSIKNELQDSVEAALSSGSSGTGLILMVFFAVAREGLESVFFLLAIFQQSAGPAAPLSALAGLLVSIAIGYIIYAFGIRLNLKRFFRWTGIFILFVAAGLLSAVVRSLHEAGLWNMLQERAYDMSGIVSQHGMIGTVLSGLLNYQESPAVGEVIVYLAFLLITLALFLAPQKHVPAGAAHPEGARS